MTDIEHLRHSILSQAETMGTKKRFGLFSHPISTAIGDDSPFRSKEHPRNQMGKPVTQPRNIYASPIKQGKLNKSYFAPLNSLATHSIHDNFIQEGSRLLKQQNKAFNQGRKQVNFVPPNGKIKPIINSAYPYKGQMNPQLDPKRYKMEDGRIKTGSKNFYTNPGHRVIDTLFKPYKHVPDPYQRAHQLELEHLQKQRSKEREQVFKPNNFSPKLLNKHSLVYASDISFTKKPQNESLPSIYQHQSPWRSSSKAREGIHSLFQPVHPYIENPPAQRKPKQISLSQKQSFKGMSPPKLASPSPSISLNRVNMISHIRRNFSPKH